MSKIKCHLCEKTSHFVQNCPNFADLKADFNKKGGSQPKAQANLIYGTTIIDSGATQHMFHSKESFDDDLRAKKTTDACANSQEIESIHTGTVNISLGDSIKALRDVLHVPELKKNLLSVRALTREGHKVTFNPDGTVVMTETDNDEHSFEIGQAVGDLYHLTTTSFGQEALAITKEEDCTFYGITDLAIPDEKP
jgi:hypothetical protein